MARAPKTPPANATKEGVALRKAAIAFTRNIGEPTDMDDTRGTKLNGTLLKAAIAYAEAARRETAGDDCPVCDGTGKGPEIFGSTSCTACGGSGLAK